jgi:hypothetical protein
VVHGDDIVPRVPWLLGAYRHAGHEVFFPGVPVDGQLGDAAFLVDPSLAVKAPLDCRNAIRELTGEKVAWLADHHVDTYLGLFQPIRSYVFNS